MIFGLREVRDRILEAKRVLLCIGVLIAAFLCFWNLGERSIGAADESLYVRSVQEMQLSGGVVPTLNGGPFLHKPPLIQFLMLGSVEIFGQSNFANRFIGALAGVLTLILVPVFAYSLFRSIPVAVFSFLSFSCCKMLFTSHLFREAVSDGLLLFFITGALVSGWKFFESSEKGDGEDPSHKDLGRRGFLTGAFILGALLTKSVAGLLPILIMIVFLLIRRGRLLQRECLQPMVLSILIAPVVLASIIFFAFLLSAPGSFGTAFGYEVWEKLVSEGHHNTERLNYYFKQLFLHGRAQPWLLIAAGLIFGIAKCFKHDARFQYLLTWALVPVFGYSLLHSRLYWYIAPSFPAFAILSGAALGTLTSLCLEMIRLKQILEMRFLVVVMLLVFLFGSLLEYQYVIVGGIISKTDKIPLERVTTEAVILAESTPSSNIVRYCMTPANPLYSKVRWRSWYYLDRVKSVATDICDEKELAKYIRSGDPTVIFIAEQQQQSAMRVQPPCAYATIRLDGWNGKKSRKKVKTVVALAYNLCDKPVLSEDFKQLSTLG